MTRLGLLLLVLILLLPGASSLFGQTSTPDTPVINYTVQIDTADLSGYTVTIQVSHAPHHFHLAMATHHEYDDRFWRYVTDFKADSPASFIREDSAVWSITTTGNEADVSYRIQLPPQPSPIRFSHRPFLTSTGGLIGDLHSFMYVVESPSRKCGLELGLPYRWEVASGLEDPPPPSESDPPREVMLLQPGQSPFVHPYFAKSAPRLLDAPILIGLLHRWWFREDGVLHEVAYLSQTPTLSIDTIALVANIRKIVAETHDLLRGFPYEHYSFLLRDASAGALEHGNSVTIGATPSDLANPTKSGIYEQLIHEYFHTWNGMSIQPSGYTPLNYGPQQLTTGLWFTEGVTMLYADLIARRTHLPVEDSTRLSHLTRLITRYYRDTGNCVLPPSKVSLADYVQPGPLGDYTASTHLQGELLGGCLDFLIRDATGGKQSLDDLLREVFLRCGNKQPLTDSILESVAATVCHCDAAHTFFRDYLSEGKPIDFAAYLHLMGLRFKHDQPQARDAQGRSLADTRVYSWILRDDTSLRIGITNPNTPWAKAGLHTGDIIVAIDNRPLHSRQDFQSALSSLHVGDTVHLTVKKETGTKTVPVYITGYTTPSIVITENPAATSKQKQLLRTWSSAVP